MQTENQNFFTFQIIVYIGKVKLNKNVFLYNKIMVNINIFIKSDNKFWGVAQHHQLKEPTI